MRCGGRHDDGLQGTVLLGELNSSLEPVRELVNGLPQVADGAGDLGFDAEEELTGVNVAVLLGFQDVAASGGKDPGDGVDDPGAVRAGERKNDCRHGCKGIAFHVSAGGIFTCRTGFRQIDGIRWCHLSKTLEKLMDLLNSSIAEVDPEIAAVLENELGRQRDTLEMIASENFVPRAVLEAQGSVLTNKYAEGYPGRRYYGGCEHVDVAENLAIERAKAVFGCEYVNVQPHSGAQANAGYLPCARHPR